MMDEHKKALRKAYIFDFEQTKVWFLVFTSTNTSLYALYQFKKNLLLTKPIVLLITFFPNTLQITINIFIFSVNISVFYTTMLHLTTLIKIIL